MSALRLPEHAKETWIDHGVVFSIDGLMKLKWREILELKFKGSSLTGYQYMREIDEDINDDIPF